MKLSTIKRLWIFPFLFGLLGAFIGLVLRFAFTGNIAGFPFKYVLHSHSHVMLLGFVLNSFVVLLWTQFTDEIDKKSYKLYMALQGCMAILLVAFIIQGYAFVTILFSTLHLWISYVLLIRLWKRLTIEGSTLSLIKLGIIFHFIASIGPYALGPLMALEMQESPWYQQAIFFYLHFQYFGSFFLWMLAILFHQLKVTLSKRQIGVVVVSIVLLYAHTLVYNFNHRLLQISGVLGAVLLLGFILGLKEHLLKKNLKYKIIYQIILLIALLNCLGSTTYMADLVSENRFVLIAWLHLLFLGLYLPFIWILSRIKIAKWIWIVYALALIASEIILVFPATASSFFSTSVMWLLFLSYLGVVLCISIVHLKTLVELFKK